MVVNEAFQETEARTKMNRAEKQRFEVGTDGWHNRFCNLYASRML